MAAGRIFNWLVARLGLCGVADSQCGFKAFTAEAANALFPRVSTDGARIPRRIRRPQVLSTTHR
ncbi:MAG: hypothetical protein HY239_20010 [Mycolicibacterium aromaticivorans]|nr:hypothetical protein [Mycolicibacterium aromaticivorans]